MFEKLSHYRIVRKIGAGGMGEVYEAQDTTLGRTVALKILPADVAQDPRRLRRFAQEAKAASSLNHPNITQIYEIGMDNGVHFIAMEYVGGETLESRLRRGALPQEDLLLAGIQVAEALQVAHAQRIVHRDIKPSNIMVTPSGQIKVLDFGLAKVSPAQEDSGLSQTRTEGGMILGTVYYMSPEQALSETVDHRSDIFSLGTVLYEMSTGKRPFSGPNAQAVLQHIISDEVDLHRETQETSSNELEFCINKCLRKKPAERYQSAADLAADLSVLLRRLRGESGGRITLGEPEYFIPRLQARMLFLLIQCMYLVFYVLALRWPEASQANLIHMLGDGMGKALWLLYMITAPVGIAVRLYLISTVMWDHISTGVRYRKAFPVYFLLDVLWAASPYAVSAKIGELLTMACVAPLAFSPFGQRTLIRAAYNVHSPGRITSGA